MTNVPNSRRLLLFVNIIIYDSKFQYPIMKYETNLQSGLREVLCTGRPGMVVVHTSSCNTCRVLWLKFLLSLEIETLSNFFVIMNLIDENMPTDEKWCPDGAYIPRIFFLDPKGRIMYDIFNSSGNPKYKYFYDCENNLIRSMKRVLCKYPPQKGT